MDIVDEVGAVSGEPLHADALRTTYAGAQRYDLNIAYYLQRDESPGSMFAKLYAGDFLQLPPVHPSLSFLFVLSFVSLFFVHLLLFFFSGYFFSFLFLRFGPFKAPCVTCHLG